MDDRVWIGGKCSRFPYIAKYSPYGNVHKGTAYPAVFFTGDGDTRVDPMNAHKMTPLMQAATSSNRPVLLHYSLKGGHSDRCVADAAGKGLCR